DCGAPFSLPVVTNVTNISTLVAGDKVTVGGFTCKLLQVQPAVSSGAAAGGAWQGYGQIVTPWLGGTINCRFTDIYVNTNKEVYKGNIVANALNLKKILDIMKIPDEQKSELDFCLQSKFPKAPLPPRKVAVGYDPYNPSNTKAPYDPYDYKNPNNPYTAKNPYNPYSINNPYNFFHPYDPADYTDPSNPYTAANPYKGADISRLDSLAYLTTQGQENAFPLFASFGLNVPIVLSEDTSRYKISIINVIFSPQGAVLDAYMHAPLPSSEQYAVFKMNKVGFHPGGLLGESKLFLGADLTYTSFFKSQITLKGGGNTSVAWDCNGFKSFSLQGSVAFCHDLVLPVDVLTGKTVLVDTTKVDKGTPKEKEYYAHKYVTGSFQMTITDLAEFAGSLSITPFTLPQLPGYTFTVQDAFFDFSETLDPAKGSFPKDYEHPLLKSGEAVKWTGVLIKRLQIMFPRKCPWSKGSKSSPEQLTLGATNMIVDDLGVTGDFFVKNLIPISEGRISTWAASIDSVNISILKSQFRSFAVKGTVVPPPFKDTIGYGCIIQPGSHYAFSIKIKTNKEIPAPPLHAKFLFMPNTEITVGYNDTINDPIAELKIYGKAMYMPSISKSAAAKQDSLKIPFIQVEGLHLSAAAPYVISGGKWSFSNTGGELPKVSKFPITIKNAGFGPTGVPGEMAFSIGIAVNLTTENTSSSGSKQTQGLKAEGGAKIICNVKEDTVSGKQIWTYDRVFLDSLVIDYSAPGYKVAGKIVMFEHNAIYGTGFQGSVKAEFEPKLKVDAGAMFGIVNDYFYMFIDAYASFTPGKPLGTSGLALYGFGGGLSLNMKRSISVDASVAPYGVTTRKTSTTLGYCIDGAQYIPDSRMLFGIKARIGLGTVKKEIFNGDLIFEIIFNNGGGVEQISFRGAGRYMTPPDEPGKPKKEPQISCAFDMLYNIPSETFHATADLTVNVAKETITGAYTGKLAGRGVIHADPSEWYIHIGTPEKRIMLSFALGPLKNMAAKPGASIPDTSSRFKIDWSKLGLLVTAYFDAGSVLPAFPGMSPELQAAFPGYIPASSASGHNGGGVMFGASLAFDIPEIGFAMFYGKFGAGAGFDVMLKDYGEDAHCEGSNPPLGINGWYASGQFYAYLTGAIGLKFKLLGKQRRVQILAIAAGAFMEAKLPNPLWAKGTIGGSYSALGGLFHGKCHFPHDIGKECKIVGSSPLGDIQLIAGVTPVTGSEDVDVFTRPRATFSIPVGHVFEIEDNDEVKFYKAEKQTFELRYFSGNALVGGGEKVDGVEKWNSTNDVVGITPTEILKGKTKFKLTVSLNFLQSADGLSNWTMVQQDNGANYIESVTSTFTSGEAPDYIPDYNVAYSYPARNQTNFLKGESTNGYVKLIQGQAYLFKGQADCALDPTKWNQKARFFQGNIVQGESDLTYNAGTKLVSFAIPQAIPNDAVLQLSLANVPTAVTQALDADVVTQVRNLATPDPSVSDPYTVLMNERVAQGNITELQTNQLYRQYLRTSLYNTFSQKVDAMRTKEYWEAPMFFSSNNGLGISQFGIKLTGPEYFDATDLNGRYEDYENGTEQYRIKPMVRPEAVLGQNQTAENWYTNAVYPGMYSKFPNLNIPAPLGRPDTSVMGRVPVRNGAVAILYADGMPSGLTEQNISSGTYTLSNNICRLSYRPQYYMKIDEWDFTTQVNEWLADHGNIPPAWETFRNSFDLPALPEGFYTTQLKYYLPGQTTPNSVKTVQVKLENNGN
ncbi:MAG: hypothetical protein Q7T20_02420, partial [Saprospiraceae bacterium]|nr:hypothetical protein [Saprospiraceae bacterium]